MGLIDYLVVVGIVVLILVVYRQLDRNNRSLEKVKKLGDKLMGDLDMVVQEKAIQLKDLAIEVEVHHEASRRAIEHLKAAESGLEEKASQLDQLQTRIGGYDTALVELITMTQKAEENIGRLREESAYIDKVGRRIRQAAGQLQELQNRLPGMMDEFRAANKASLDETQERLLASVETRHTTLERRVEDADRQSAERIHRMQVLIEEVEGDLSKRVEVYREAFGGLEQEYQRRLEDLRLRGEQLESAAMQRALVVDSQAEEKVRNLQGLIQEVEADLSGRVGMYRDTFGGIEKEYVRRVDEVSRQSADRLNRMQARIDEVDAELGTRVDGYRHNFDTIENEYQKRLDDVAQRGLRLETEALSRLGESIQKHMDEKHQILRQDIEGMATRIREEEYALEQEITRLKDRGQSWETEMDHALQAANDRLEQGLREREALAQTEVEKYHQAIEAGQKKLIQEIHGVRDAARAETEGVQTLVQELVETARKDAGLYMDGFRSEISTWQRDVENYHREVEEEVRQQSGEHQEAFSRELDNMLSRLESIKADLESQIDESQQANLRTLDDFQGGMHQRIESMQGQLYQAEQNTEQKLLLSQEKGQALAETLLSRISNDVDAKTASMREAIQQRVEDVNASVKASHDQIDSSFNELRSRVDGWIDNSRQYMGNLETQLRDLAESSHKASTEQRETMDAYIQETRSNLDSWERQLGSRVQELEGFIARSEDLVQTEFKRLRDEAQVLAGKTGQEVQEIFTQERQAILQKSADQLDALRAQIHDGQQGLENEYRRIFDRIAEWENSSQGRQKDFEESSNSLAENYAADFRRRMDELESQLEGRNTRLRDDFARELENQRQGVEEVLAQSRTRLEEARVMQGDLDGQHTDMDARIARLRSDFQNSFLLLDKETMAEKNRIQSEFGTVLARLESQVKDELEAHAQEVQKHMEETSLRLNESGKAFQDELSFWKEGLESRIGELSTLSQGLHKDTLVRVQDQVNNVQKQAQDFYARIQEDLKEGLVDQEQRIKTLLGSNEDDLKRLGIMGLETQNRIKNWQDLLQDTARNLDTELEKVRIQALDEAGRQVGGMKELVLKQQEDALQVLNEGFTRLKSEVHHSRNDVEQDVKFLNQQIEQWKATFQEQLKNLEIQSRSIEDEAFEGLKARINGLREEARDLTRKVQEEFIDASQEAQGQVARQIDSYKEDMRRLSAVKAESDARLGELAAEIGKAKTGSKAALEALAAETDRSLKEIKEKLVLEIQGRNLELGEQVKQTLDSGNQHLAELKIRQDKDNEKLVQVMDQARLEVQEKLKALQQESLNLRRDAMGNIQERIDSLRDEARKLTGQVKSEINTVLADHQAQVDKQLKNSEDEFHRIQDLNSTAQLRFQEIQDVFNRAEQMAMKEYESLREKTRQMMDQNLGDLQKELSRQQQEMQGLVQQNIVGFSDSVVGVRKEMQQDLQLLQGELGHYKGDMEERIKSIGVDARKLQEELNQTLKADLEKVRRQGEQLAQAMHEQVLKGLEAQRGEISALVETGSSDLARARGFTVEAQAMMETTKASMQAKVAELDASIKNYSQDSARRIEKASEEYQQEILGSIEKRLKDYEQEISYRMEKIETVNDDIDNLEANLRKSMDRLAQRLKEEVERMGGEFRSRHQADVEQSRKDLEGVSLQMVSLEKELADLKTRAYDNVSQNLKVFEDEFFVDLKNRSQKMDQKINDWKSQVENLLGSISEKEVAERKMLEEAYSNLIKTRLTEMEAHFKDRLSRTGADFETFQASLQERLLASEQGIQRMQSELKEEVQGLQADTLENVQREFVRMNQDLDNRIRAYEREVESRLQKGDQEFRLRQSDLGSLMDTVRNDVNLWQNQVLNQIRSSGDSVQEELVAFKRETEAVINDVQNSYARERDELAIVLGQERNNLKKDLGDVGERLQRFSLELDQKSRDTIEQFNRNYQVFMGEMETGNAGLKEEVAEQLAFFKDFVASSRSEFESMQRKHSGKMDEELRNVDNNLKDMDKRIKAFVAQTKLFERADILKDSLTDQIEKMRLDLQSIEEQRKSVLDLDSYLSKVRKLAEEANEKIGKLTAEKRRLDSLDEDYKKLISISNVVDQKIAQVTASNDTLTEIQLTLRHLEDVQKDVSAKYDRLERKSDVIDATSEGIERSFTKLQGIEQDIQTVQTAMRDLPGQVADLSDRVKNLLSGKKDADAALKSVSNLDKLLKDVESRIQELNTSREWIARTETRLNELTKDAEEKVNLLSALVRKEVAADKTVANPGGPSQSVREIVLKLAQQGWRVEEIARTTKLSRGEVELILEMRAR